MKRYCSLFFSLLLLISLISLIPVHAAGTDTISEITLYGEVNPSAGNHPGNITTDTYGVYIDYADWIDDYNNIMDPSLDEFEAGMPYTLNIFMTANPGYQFADNVTVHYPDHTETVSSEDSNSSLNCFYTYTVPDSLQSIGNVRLEGLMPAQEGYSPDFTVTLPQGSLYSAIDSYWIDDSGNFIWSDNAFVSGHTYTHVIQLIPHQGYEFLQGGVIAEYAGKVETVSPSNGKLTIRDSYTIDKPYYKPVSNVIVNSAAQPVEGNTPDFSSEILDGYCTVSQTLWMDQNNKTLQPQDHFQAGQTYYRILVLSAQAGYCFAEPTSVQFGYNQTANMVYPDPYSDHKEVLSIAQTFIAEKKPQPKIIDSLTIYGIISPKDGETPSLGMYFEDTPSVSIISNTWKDEDGNEVNSYTGFEGNRSYERLIIIEAINGYRFTQPVKVTLDGETQTIDPKNNRIQISRWYKVPKDKHIHQLTFVKGVEPTEEKMGMKPYYRCTCGKYFEDSKAEKEIKENINKWRLIPPLRPESEKPSVESTPSLNEVCWTGTEETLQIKIPGDLSKLTEVRIDDKTVDKKLYQIDPETAMITFSAELLNTYPSGSHKLSFIYSESQMDLNLIIESTSTLPQPQAESPSPLPWIIACIACILCGAAAAFLITKKKQK